MSNVALSFEHILKYKFIQALLTARRLLKFGVAKHKISEGREGGGRSSRCASPFTSKRDTQQELTLPARAQ